MKAGNVVLAVGLLIASLAAPVWGATTDRFEGNVSSVTAILPYAGAAAAINLTVPAESVVLNATMKVSGFALNGKYPAEPELLLDGTTIWKYSGPGFGALGKQSGLSTGQSVWKTGLGAPGGNNLTSLLIPKGATIKCATMNVSLDGPWSPKSLFNITGTSEYQHTGYAISGVGDVNNDSYPDFLISAPGYYYPAVPGTCKIYLGGPVLDAVADITLVNPTSDMYFGVPAAGAGDVNGDGYDDVIVGVPSEATGGMNAGRAYIYFGGQTMNGIADTTLNGTVAANHVFGGAVSAAGDVNRDGYDDVLVGEYGNTEGGAWSGKAYIFFGGASMDGNYDISFKGSSGAEFGISVANAGDVNQDGYTDQAIGAPFHSDNGQGRGCAYVFKGGSPMNNFTNTRLIGQADWDGLGMKVAGAGDVNGDGYDDILVSGHHGQVYAGQAYILFGGQTINSTPDITLTGPSLYDEFGTALFGAGDLDGDGYDDILAGGYYTTVSGTHRGQAYIYRGGRSMDTVPDAVFPGEETYDFFGYTVCAPGDLDQDGSREIAIGAPYYDSVGQEVGKVYLITLVSGVLAPNITVGSSQIWTRTGYTSGSYTTADFSATLNNYLASASNTITDQYGNLLAYVPLAVNGKSLGNITITGINIEYSYNATVQNFSVPLNSYIDSHRNQKDALGNLRVPLTVRAQEMGKLNASGLRIVYDGAPNTTAIIPDQAIDEDTAVSELVELYDYFADEHDGDSGLRFGVENVTNGSLVNVSISDGHFLSADAATGSANDNWTGDVFLRVRCYDTHGFSSVSNRFRIVVRNVNDPPVIVSAPPLNASFGYQYIYQVVAQDGDADVVVYGLAAKPDKMTITPEGRIYWTPARGGSFDVSISVSDNISVVYQNYTLALPNRAPRITSSPPDSASFGAALSYNVTAVDDDNDTLAYSVLSSASNVTIDPGSGKLNWAISGSGTFAFNISVSDGVERAFQNFSLQVQNRGPNFTSTPITGATEGEQYTYDVAATDADGQSLVYNLTVSPPGMAIVPNAGKITWTPGASQSGVHKVTVTVSDGTGGTAEQTFNLTVRARPSCTITFPFANSRTGLCPVIKGTAGGGSPALSAVLVRLDGGQWTAATGNELWSFSVKSGALKSGKHTVEARAYDGTRYSDTASVTFTVQGEIPITTEAAPVIPIMAIIAVIGCIIGAMLWMRTRKPETQKYMAKGDRPDASDETGTAAKENGTDEPEESSP